MVQKEAVQILRNRAMLPMIFVMPIVQLLVLAHAATYEIRNINVQAVDHDGSQLSRRLIGKFDASPFFNVIANDPAPSHADRALERGTVDVVVEVPVNFERDLLRDDGTVLYLKFNAINGAKAGVAASYSNSIILDFNQNIRRDFGSTSKASLPGQIMIEYSNWFNPGMNFKTFMVPGILVMLVTMVGLFLTGMNIVREKEIGTIEQLNVTPLRKYEFVIGKMLPFWILGLFELGLGLGVGIVVFDLPIVGQPALVFLFAMVYLLVVMGIGLFISTVTETQQQSMLIAWFFTVIFILMSGLFTPIEGMPQWAQKITLFNPVAYFVKVIRMVILKGSGWQDIKYYVFILVGYAMVINSLAVWNYRKKM
jgi:ABC-2 type transport system permease protein